MIIIVVLSLFIDSNLLIKFLKTVKETFDKVSSDPSFKMFCLSNIDGNILVLLIFNYFRLQFINKKRICAIEKTEENQWTVILRIYIRLKINKSNNEEIYRNILPIAPRF